MDSTPPPRASVVIPARNAAATIGEQLEALCAQDTTEPFEVIVVVNGCTDNTEAEARAYEHRLDLRIIHSEPGYSSSRNAGAMAARSDIILFCDADDAARPDWMRTLSSAVEARHGIVGGFFGYTRFNSNEQCEAYGFDPNDPDGREASLGSDDFSDQRSVSGGNFGVWRPDFQRTGGLDNSYRGGLEETDFCFRARRLGIPVTFCTRARIEVRLRADPKRAFTQQRGYAVNKILFMVRTQIPDPAAVKDLPYAFNLSLKWSVAQLTRYTLRSLTLPFQSAKERMETLHHLGGHLGSVEGHIRYRVLRRVPERELISATSTVEETR